MLKNEQLSDLIDGLLFHSFHDVAFDGLLVFSHSDSENYFETL